MKARLVHLLLLLAAFMAAGSQWDFVQVFAWSRMFLLNTRTLSVQTSLSETFNPARRCALCRAVATAREAAQGQSQPPDTKYAKALLLAFAPRSLFIAHPAEIRCVRLYDWHLPEGEKSAPPVPPPRT